MKIKSLLGVLLGICCVLQAAEVVDNIELEDVVQELAVVEPADVVTSDVTEDAVVVTETESVVVGAAPEIVEEQILDAGTQEESKPEVEEVMEPVAEAVEDAPVENESDIVEMEGLEPLEDMFEDLDTEGIMQELVEYHCLDDLLQKEPHAPALSQVVVEHIVKVGIGLVSSLAVKYGIKQACGDFKRDHKHLRDGIVAAAGIGVYALLGKFAPQKQAIYRSILTNIFKQWKVHQVLIPGEYFDLFEGLYQSFVKNNNELPLTEKEAKRFVNGVKYDLNRQIKTREALLFARYES